MKQIILFFALVLSQGATAQMDNYGLPQVSERTEELKEKAKQAHKNYQDALSEEQKAQAEYIKRNNELEKARQELRQANLALRSSHKEDNPIREERYQVLINPIYQDMSKGTKYGLVTFVEGTETSGMLDLLSKDVDKEFKSYLKQFKSSKIKKSKGELFFDNIVIPEMSTTTIDLYVDFDEVDHGVNILTYFDMGSEFLDTNIRDDSSVDYAYRLMDNFARYIRENILEDEINSLEKDLKNAQDSLEDEKKNIGDYKNEIQSKQTDIANGYNKISELESIIDSLNDKLELSRARLSKVQ